MGAHIRPGETITDEKVSGRNGDWTCEECGLGMPLDGSIRVTLTGSELGNLSRDLYVHPRCLPRLRQTVADARAEATPAGHAPGQILARCLGVLDLPPGNHRITWGESVTPIGHRVAHVERVPPEGEATSEGYVVFDRRYVVVVAFWPPRPGAP